MVIDRDFCVSKVVSAVFNNKLNPFCVLQERQTSLVREKKREERKERERGRERTGREKGIERGNRERGIKRGIDRCG